jgi:hypothetical protein
MSTCSLSGNTLTSTSDIIFNPYNLGDGILFKAVSGPTYYISSYNNLIIESDGTIKLGVINSAIYGLFTNSNGFTISSQSGNLNLSSPSNGTINLQNGTNTYGTISNDNGLHIQNKSSYIVIDSNGSSNPIYMYTGTTTPTSSPNGLILQTLQTGSAATYGSFYNETNTYSIPSDIVGIPNTPLGLNNLTIEPGNVGGNPGSIRLLGAGPSSGETIAVVVGEGYYNSANISMYYNQYVNNGSVIINTPNQLTLQSNSNIYLNANINNTTNNIINLQNNGATYGSFNNQDGFTISSSNKLNLVSSSSNSINLCCNSNTNGDTTININTPDGSQIGGGNYCTIKTTGRGSNLEIDTAGNLGSITFNASSGLATNYEAGWDPYGKGIINQTALGYMFQAGQSTLKFNGNNQLSNGSDNQIRFVPTMVFFSLNPDASHSVNNNNNSIAYAIWWNINYNSANTFTIYARATQNIAGSTTNITVYWLALNFSG